VGLWKVIGGTAASSRKENGGGRSANTRALDNPPLIELHPPFSVMLRCLSFCPERSIEHGVIQDLQSLRTGTGYSRFRRRLSIACLPRSQNEIGRQSLKSHRVLNEASEFRRDLRRDDYFLKKLSKQIDLSDAAKI
jgi:hypothetical protein